MEWILMVVILNNGEYHAHPPSYQEFYTVLACQKAEKIVDETYSRSRFIKWSSVCIPKGDLK